MLTNQLLFMLLIGLSLSNIYIICRLKLFIKHGLTLDAQPQFQHNSILPKLSIIIPVHNEQRKLKAALLSVCKLDYPNKEIIAVNDRSSDSSQAILENLREQYQHLQLIEIKRLPENWLGKTHALFQGAKQASGDYLLFTDADVIFDKNSLKKVMQYVIDEQLDHLTLSPKILMPSFTIRCLMPFFNYCMFFSLKPWLSNNPSNKTAIGVGAFNLIKTSAYETIGNMQGLALEVVDDMGLAARVKGAKLKHAYADGRKLVAVEWYSNALEALKGLEKNIFASMNYSYLFASVSLVISLVWLLIPWLALFNSYTWPAATFTLLTSTLMIMLFCTELGVARYFAIFYPISALLMFVISLRAILMNAITGHLQWGHRTFSIKQLRNFQKNQKKKNLKTDSAD